MAPESPASVLVDKYPPRGLWGQVPGTSKPLQTASGLLASKEEIKEGWTREKQEGKKREKQSVPFAFMFVSTFVSSLDFQGLYSRIKLCLTWGSKFPRSLLEVSTLVTFSTFIYHSSKQYKALATSLLLPPAFPPPAFCRKPSSKASDETLSAQ